ncbi:uncharacterized protein LOC129612386 [Condylostylus longicornis]|uniref:uncharacterized protein LOC129612386 n=1 Tax=Condylostylus longicornis TaxID=2530218 RepID=UPI00244DB724|nr:uncharacterized protein LOC129612386 [Condylostylus longicornis]
MSKAVIQLSNFLKKKKKGMYCTNNTMILRLIGLFLIWKYSVPDTIANKISVATASFQEQIRTNNSEDYGIQTIYTSSANIPVNQNKSVNTIVKDQKTQYFFIISKKNDTALPMKILTTKFKSKHSKNLSQKSYEKQSGIHDERYDKNSLMQNLDSKIQNNYSKTSFIKNDNNKHVLFFDQHQTNLQPQRRSETNFDCVKCPPEKIFIAPKGFDSVIVDQPKLFSCNNKAILNKAYFVETLYGPRFKFLLPQGTHRIYGRIKNKMTEKAVQTCMLRYKVVVRQCEKIVLSSKNINVNCDLGQIWGSKCTFICHRGYLSVNTSVICNDSLQWEGEQPKCLLQPSSKKNQSCNFLPVPKYARFSCQYPNYAKTHHFENPTMKAPAGTMCHIKCNRNFEIIPDLKFSANLKCIDGKWNATVSNICQPKGIGNL